MSLSRFQPPQPIANFNSECALTKAKFNADIIDSLLNKHAAGIRHVRRPTAAQLRHWMNSESKVPNQYHMAIYDLIGKLNGRMLLQFVHNNGSSIRGFVHLIHQVGSCADRAVHFVDRYSDYGDQREVFGRGYVFI